MTDLGQYSALQDTNSSNRVANQKVRDIAEYKELGVKIRRLRQYIGSMFGTGEDTIDEEAYLTLLKLKQHSLFKRI